jgi:cytochrome c peroxidase
LAGVAVTWGNVTGGGSLTGATQITASNGVVTLGSWTLGAPGPNTITASAAGLTPVTFKATAAGAATHLLVAVGNNQTALVGRPVSGSVCVQTTDDNDTPVSGVTVTWIAPSKRGAISGAVQITDSTGIASLGSWTLGRRPGMNTVTATSPGLSGATFIAEGVTEASSLQTAMKLAPVSSADYYDDGSPDPDKLTLGRFLFFDRVLSASSDVACATCHNPNGATGDALSLSLGVGAQGLTSARIPANTPGRAPRNATMLFNLGARQFSHIFADGRVELDPTQPTGFGSPAGVNLPQGLDNVLAVQALFPLQSAPEMVSTPGSDPISDAAAVGNLVGPNGVWAQLVSRLRAIPEYVQLFQAAYPGEILSAGDIAIVYAANAIAAFETSVFRADNSPFDRYLRGDRRALTATQLAGMKVFYGKGNCFACHSGVFQTDQQFHNIAMPQIGPGKGDGVDGRDDYGRQRVTKTVADQFKFSTPSLRNVELTAPYGHDGAYATLEAVIRHHLNPVQALNTYDTKQAVLPSRPDLDALDFIAQSDPSRRSQIAAGVELKPVVLSARDVKSLVEFLKALTDPNSRNLQSVYPDLVPSGLPLDQ